jgi:thymidylate synthase (FAD)
MKLKIMKPQFELITSISSNGTAELDRVARFGKLCYFEEWDGDIDDNKTFVRRLISKGYLDILEQSMISVRMAISVDMVSSLNSMLWHKAKEFREYKIDKGLSVIDISESIVSTSEVNRTEHDKVKEIIAEWEESMRDAERHYNNLLRLGAPKDIANSVVPTSIATVVFITATYKDWRDFLKSWINAESDRRLREIAVPLLNMLKRRIPVIFEDIGVLK